MISIKIAFALFVTHWIADFIAQTYQWSITKYKGGKGLLFHSLTYGALLWLGMLMFTPQNLLLGMTLWCVVNMLLHGGVDYITSNMTHILYKKQDYHNFFVVIGMDQMIHMLLLFGSLGVYLS